MSGSLGGRTVLVTRPRAQAAELVRLLEHRGARTIVAPAIRLVPAPARQLDAALERVLAGEFAWVVLTSRAGVEALLGRLDGRRERFGGARVAAVGEGTAAALRGHGIRPSLVPGTFTTAALGRAMPRGTGRILLARADIAPEGLEAALERKGWSVDRVDAYRTRSASGVPVEARRALVSGTVDALTFTSASTARGFVRLAGGLFRHPAAATAGRRPPRVVCIGPVTAAEARALGLRVHAVADPHTIEGLVAAVERALEGRAAARRRP